MSSDAHLLNDLRDPDRSLARQVGELAREQGVTIAVAESLTGGTVAAEITSVSGSSDYFLGGVVAYTLEAKAEILGVDGKHAAGCNCVSKRVAHEMASGVRNLFGADIGIATTGYAEPTGDQPVPMAYFAANGADWAVSGQVYGEGLDRVGMQRLVTQTVLERLVLGMGGGG